MAPSATLLPPQSVFDFNVDRIGPVSAEQFERWAQVEGKPVELIEGWVLPMSPGNYLSGRVIPALWALLEPLASARGWELLLNARHQLPLPPETVVFPDLALHCAAVEATAELGTVLRVPDLVVEFLSEATAGRDRGPHGAKFLAYELCGVSEYYHVWPNGREATAYRLDNGRYLAIPADADGFFDSPLLGRRFRLVPPAIAD